MDANLCISWLLTMQPLYGCGCNPASAVGLLPTAYCNAHTNGLLAMQPVYSYGCQHTGLRSCYLLLMMFLKQVSATEIGIIMHANPTGITGPTDSFYLFWVWEAGY